MQEIEVLKRFIRPPIEISTNSFSYIERLFPEFERAQYLVVHKVPPKPKCIKPKTECIEEDDISQFDVTGSPLKYTFERINFDDTYISPKRYWRKVEEEYLPLSTIEACNLLNVCLEHRSKKCLPIFVLCDGKDKRNRRLLGAIVQGEWYTTIEVCSAKVETFSAIKEFALKPLQEHLQLSAVQEHEVTISACNTFDLFGTRAETMDWNETEMSDFEGSLIVNVDTSSLSVDPPTRASKNNLVIEVASGFKASLLKKLWTELQLLDQYLTLIEEYKQDYTSQYNPVPLRFPGNFKSTHFEEDDKIIENLNFLLSGDYTYRNMDNTNPQINFINETNVDDDIKLEQHIRNLACRHTLDFTDLLWELLIQNKSHIHMTKCIHMVLTEILSGGCLTQVNLSNTTRFAKVISNSDPEKMLSHLLGSLPLEYVVDMGLEKLHRDYAYILINAGFSEAHEHRKLGSVSSGEFKVDSYRKRLLYMAQIHVCLEFMLLLQTNLPCPTDHISTLFSIAFKQFVGEKSPLQDHLCLHKNTIYNLTAPLPVSIINEMSKEVPSTRRISLSSRTTLSRTTTTRYYSRLPIFPTNMYPPDDINTMDETYHVVKCICSSRKFK